MVRFLELQKLANTKGPAAMFEFTDEHYEKCFSHHIAGTDFELGTKAKQSSAAQTEPQLAPAGHAESTRKDKKCDRGLKKVAVMVLSWHLTCTPLRRYMGGQNSLEHERQMWDYILKHIYMCVSLGSFQLIKEINIFLYSLYIYICAGE